MNRKELISNIDAKGSLYNFLPSGGPASKLVIAKEKEPTQIAKSPFNPSTRRRGPRRARKRRGPIRRGQKNNIPSQASLTASSTTETSSEGVFDTITDLLPYAVGGGLIYMGAMVNNQVLKYTLIGSGTGVVYSKFSEDDELVKNGLIGGGVGLGGVLAYNYFAEDKSPVQEVKKATKSIKKESEEIPLPFL